jgi:hypothetical protein
MFTKVSQSRLLAMIIGSCFTGLWTLLRFFNTSSTFDLTTQQVLAHSWLHGYSGVVSLGATNYLLKVFLIYMPADLLPGSPLLKLIVVTLLINIATFLILFVVLQNILQEFKIKANGVFYGVMIWMTTIAGSLFWIEYANSRNLEVAGSMLLVWGILRLIKRPKQAHFAGLIAVSGILFFADSLTAYMVALPLIVYVMLLLILKKLVWKRLAMVAAIFSLGYLLSFGLNAVARHFLHLQVNQPPTSGLSLQPAVLGHAGKLAIQSTLRQFAGGPDAGHLRQVVNLLFFGAGVVCFAVGAVRRKIPVDFSLLIVSFVIINEVIYIASGTVLQADTSRYLVIIGPILVLALGSLDYIAKKSFIPYVILVVVVGFNGLFLGRALARYWDISFPMDGHLNSVSRYLKSHNYSYALAGMNTASPLAYYNNNMGSLLMPVACGNSMLVRADAFRDTSSFQRSGPDVQIPIVLDGKVISNVPSICTEQMIITQLGLPLRNETTDDGSTVLVFRNSQVVRLARP